MRHVLDTNIFNRVLDGKFLWASLPEDATFVATEIQREELVQTAESNRREKLLEVFAKIDPELLPASFSFNVAGAGFNQGRWSQGDDAEKLRQALDLKKIRHSNLQDSLIAEVALIHKCVLVTADQRLAEIAEMHGIQVFRVA